MPYSRGSSRPASVHLLHWQVGSLPPSHQGSRCGDNPISAGESFWEPILFLPLQSMLWTSCFPLSLPEEEYKFVEIRAISSGRFCSKAMPHFSSSPRGTRTAWQCSFHQTPRQPHSWNLGQFGDPKLPSLVDWNSLKRGKARAGFSRAHISSKYTAFEKSSSSFSFLSVGSRDGGNVMMRDEQTAP